VGLEIGQNLNKALKAALLEEREQGRVKECCGFLKWVPLQQVRHVARGVRAWQHSVQDRGLLLLVEPKKVSFHIRCMLRHCQLMVLTAAWTHGTNVF